SGQALENDLLDTIGLPLQPSGDLRSHRSAFWHGVQAEHVEQLPAQLRSLFLPVVQRANIAQAVRRHFGGDSLQLVGGHFVALGRGFLSLQAWRPKRQDGAGGSLNEFGFHMLVLHYSITNNKFSITNFQSGLQSARRSPTI